jgi:hypothetical protein
VKRQVGIHRTNCIDCLDRTNVVQGLLGRLALEVVLAQVRWRRRAMGAAGARALAGPSWRTR